MTIEHKTLALAGIFQTAELVRQAARENRVDNNAFQASISSVLKLDASSVVAVYGGLCGVELGLYSLCHQFEHNTKDKDWELMRYVLEMIYLEGRLKRNSTMRDTIASGIRAAQESGYPATHPNTIARLADIYSRTFGTLSHRIQVHGEPTYLHDSNNVNRIRALLLCGIRSAVLWRQSGGGALRFILQRRKILRTAAMLQQECRAALT
jgi:high frequency lysogenization protein